MKNSVLTVTHYKVTFSENCNGGSNKPQVDPKKALAQLFIDDITEFQKGKEGKEVDEAKRLKPTYPENKYHLCHIYYQEPDYEQARFRYLYLNNEAIINPSTQKFEPEKYGMVYFNLDMSGEDPSLDIFSMSDFSTEEVFDKMKNVFINMVGKKLCDMGFIIQMEGQSRDDADIDIMTIETMITQRGPIMDKVLSKNAN